MARIIRTNELKIEDIPDSNSSWQEISQFALSFDPTEELGTVMIYSHSNMEFDENSSVLELRTSLFLLQRFWNNRLDEIDEKSIKKAKDLIEMLRKKL